MKREELKTYCSAELYDRVTRTFEYGDCYLKDQADSVMDAMERRIQRLTKCVEMWHKVNEDLQSNNTQLRKRIKDFEANHKLWEAENDALKQRVKELEEKLAMKLDPALYPNCSDCDKCQPKWISVNDRLPKYSVEVLIVDNENNMYVMWRDRNNQGDCWSNWEYSLPKDRISHWMPLPPPPSTEDSSPIEKEK